MSVRFDSPDADDDADLARRAVEADGVVVAALRCAERCAELHAELERTKRWLYRLEEYTFGRVLADEERT